MIHLFLGNNATLKTEKIEEIKAKYLTAPDAVHFDYELLYGDKLDPDDLKKSLLNLPAVSKKRVVVVKFIEKLKAPHQRIIAGFLVEKDPPAVLVLDSEEAEIKNSFINDLKLAAKVVVCQEGVKANVFDMTNAMQKRQHVTALKILNELMEEGNHPLQIMPALVWFWGKMKTRLGKKHFQKGLEFLQETDLNIKRSRIKPEYAMEKLVVSLSALLI